MIFASKSSTMRLATEALKVSTEIIASGKRLRTTPIALLNRFNSSLSETNLAPGRVEQAPISIIFPP